MTSSRTHDSMIDAFSSPFVSVRTQYGHICYFHMYSCFSHCASTGSVALIATHQSRMTMMLYSTKRLYMIECKVFFLSYQSIPSTTPSLVHVPSSYHQPMLLTAKTPPCSSIIDSILRPARQFHSQRRLFLLCFKAPIPCATR